MFTEQRVLVQKDRKKAIISIIPVYNGKNFSNWKISGIDYNEPKVLNFQISSLQKLINESEKDPVEYLKSVLTDKGFEVVNLAFF